jgi:hypothetical protein
MNARKRLIIRRSWLGMVLALLVSVMLAASSPNYDFDWYQVGATGGENLASPAYSFGSATAGQALAGDIQDATYLFHVGY